MATVTKTFKENQGSNHATWTLTATGTDVTATGNTVNVPVPTITAKYTYSGKNGAWAYVSNAIFVVGGVDTGNRVSYGAEYAEGSWSSGASKTLPRSNTTFSIPTNTLFNSNNKTVRNVSVYFNSNASRGEGAVSLCSWKGVMADLWDAYDGYCGLWGPLETVTLNAPPIVTYTAPTYAIPHYAGLGAYSVTVTSASAQYGGDIQSITLKIGNEEQSQSYSSATVTNKTLTVTPSVAGTYTPTITVTDTRGQVATVNLEQITVNAYTAPNVSFDLQRTNGSGIPNAEGEHGLVTASISYTDAIAELTQPTVAIRDEGGNLVVSSATWYETWDATNGVSDAVNWTDYNPQSPVTLYAVISATGSSFSPNESYTVSITPTDNQGGVAQTITQTLSTAFFTIDFQAGGKEIAFGAPANDDLTGHPNGLFKCEMDAVFNGDVTANGDAQFDGNAQFNNDAQFDGDVYINSEQVVDYVVEQGTTNNWGWRKWNSGRLEQWYDGATGAYTVNTARGSLYSGAYINYIYPIPFIEAPSVVTGATLSTDAYVVWAQEKDYTTTSIRVRIVASASIAQNSNYAIHIHAVGKWK